MTIKEGYTRVSDILGKRSDFSNIDPQVLANKCRIGTNVHEILSSDIEGIFLSPKEDEAGYVESWVKWVNSKEVVRDNILMVEQRFYCEDLMLTGCIDGLYQDAGKIRIIDYKTSASVNKKIWHLQAGFYHYLAETNGIDLCDEVWFVHLKKDGKKARTISFPIDEYIKAVCQAEILSYRYFYG